MFTKYLTVFNYSTEEIAYTRRLVASKICYRRRLTFVRLKLSLTNSVSNRLVLGGQFRTSYFLLRHFYTNVLRATFLPNVPEYLKSHVLTNFDKKDFLLAYCQYQSIKDFDQILLWRAMQLNPLFNLITIRKKKRKKFFYRTHVFFLHESKRLLFVWRWFAVICRCLRIKKVKQKYSLLFPFENFVMAPKSAQLINDFKLQVYKLKLLQAV